MIDSHLPRKGVLWTITVLFLLQISLGQHVAAKTTDETPPAATTTPASPASPPMQTTALSTEPLPMNGMETTSATTITTVTTPTTTTTTTTTPATTTTPPDLAPTKLDLETRTYGSITVNWTVEGPGGVYNANCEPQPCDCRVNSTLHRATCPIPPEISGRVITITVTPTPHTKGCTTCEIKVLSVPGPPEDLTATAVSSTSVNMSWTAPGPKLDTFTYNVKAVAGSGEATYYAGTTNLLLPDLSSNTLYNISVQTVANTTTAVTGDNTALSTWAWNISLTHPNPVEGLGVTPSSDNMTVKWRHAMNGDTAEAGNQTGYVVLVFDTDDNSCVLEAHLSSGTKIKKRHQCGEPDDNPLDPGHDPASEYTYPTRAGAVQPCSKYNVMVYSLNAAGQSENRTEEGNTTVAEPRSQIQNVVLTPSESSIHVKWDNVKGPGRCPIVEYLVHYEYKNCSTQHPEEKKLIMSGESINEGIQPYWNYSVTVLARTMKDGGFGDSSSEPQNTTTLMDVPGPPASLDVTTAIVNTTKLAWNPPERCVRNGPITEYNVSYVCKDRAFPGSTDETEARLVESTSHTWQTKPYRECTFSVAARNEDKQGDPKTEKHNTPEDVPSAVKNAVITSNTSTTLELTWDQPDAPNGVILQYTLKYRAMDWVDGWGDSPKPKYQPLNTTDATRQATLSNLEPFTNYEIEIYGWTQAGQARHFQVFNGATIAGVPGAVNITTIDSTSTSITVTWTPGKRTGKTTYLIQAVHIPSGNRYNKTVNDYNSTSGVVIGLQPYQNYTVTVYTEVNTSSATSNSKVTETKQDIPGCVENATITSDTPTTLQVTWDPPTHPNGIILQYMMIYQAMDWVDGWGDSPKPKYQPLNATGATRQATFLDLEPYTNYEIEIDGWTMVGHALNCQSFHFPTIAGKPQNVSAVDVIKLTKRSLNVTWNPPTPRQGPTEYQINARDLTFNDMINAVNVARFNSSWGQVTVLPFRTYQISVTTIVTTGDGKVSGEAVYSSVNYTTPEDVPDAAPKVSVQKLEWNCSAQTIIWHPLDKRKRNGIVQNYTIEVTRTSTHSESIYVVKARPEKEDSMTRYEKTIALLAGEDYSINVHASTAVGGGNSTTQNIKNPLCAPPYPEGESLTDATNVVKGASDVELTQTQVEVLLSRDFFMNADSGPVTNRYLVIAQEDTVPEDEASPNGTIISKIGEFKTLYPKSWTDVQEEGNMNPFRLKLDDDLFKGIPSSYQFMSDGSGEVPMREMQADEVKFVVGDETGCAEKPTSDVCNGRLKENKGYKFRAVSCTGGGCTLTTYSAAVPTIPYPVNVAGIVAGVLVPFILIAFLVLFLFMRRQELGPFAPTPANPVLRTSPGVENGGFLIDTTQPNPVLLPDFHKHVAARHENSDLLFSEEYKLLKELSPKMSWSAAELPQNRNKNRYNNILPYDHSRIRLLAVDGEDDTGSDFINANYMPGYNSKREFIASQGPLPSTKDDFWRLIWEQNVPLVVMVTKCVEKGRQKCEQYWPNDQEPVYYGDLQVMVKSESVLNNYTIRIIDVSSGEKTRTVKQFHFVGWKDFGCPDTTDALLNFVLVVRIHSRGLHQGPVLIHCSAGVGRTGTFITVDRLLQHMRDHETVDVFGTILEMRRYRTNMVQTEDQYIYIHDCLRDALQSGFHKHYPTNAPQPSPELDQSNGENKDQPLYENLEQPLYENVEMTIRATQGVPTQVIGNNNYIGNGNNTGL